MTTTTKNQKAKKQTMFDFDFGTRDPVTTYHETDFTPMSIGTIVGPTQRVIACPKCSGHCIAQHLARNWRFIHSARIVSTAARVKFEPFAFCTVDFDSMAKLRAQGVVVCNRAGQIFEVVK